MGKFSRDKGARGERELLGLLREHLGDIVPRRSVESSRSGGHDTEISDDWPWALEIKNCASLSVWTWWRQACEQADRVKDGGDEGECIPALAYKIARRGWRFCFPVELAYGPCGPTPDETPERWADSCLPDMAETDLRGFVALTRSMLPTKETTE